MSDTILTNRRVAAAHLLRRAGFGGTNAEIDELAAMSHTDAVNKLLNVTDNGNITYEIERRLADAGMEINLNDIAYWWLVQMVRTPNPLQEKMALFWHGHFTSSYSKVREPVLLLQQNQLFRDNALGNFRSLVKQISRDPAMIDYLDGQANRKDRPNENYARELLELFTIGIGNYTESDIREAARAFTGWAFRDRAFIFNERQHDNGTKTFMGKSGNFDGDQIIDIILDNKQTARRIAVKAWNFFVYENPDAKIIEPIAETFYKSNYELKELMRAIFTSPEFLSDRAYRGLVKSPTEYVAGMLKQLQVRSFEPSVARAAAGMGQILFNPPTVKGWDGGLNWINSAYFFERINTANAALTARGGQQPSVFNLYNVLGIAPDNSPYKSADEAVGKMVELTLDGQVQPDVKAALVEYLNGGSQVTADDFKAAASGNQKARPVDVRLRGTLHLLMSTPDYMLK